MKERTPIIIMNSIGKLKNLLMPDIKINPMCAQKVHFWLISLCIAYATIESAQPEQPISAPGG
jgi:hypothetical protein